MKNQKAMLRKAEQAHRILHELAEWAEQLRKGAKRPQDVKRMNLDAGKLLRAVATVDKVSERLERESDKQRYAR